MKNLCTVCLILSVIAFLGLLFTLNLWAVPMFLVVVGFAALENHFQCRDDEAFLAAEVEEEKEWNSRSL